MINAMQHLGSSGRVIIVLLLVTYDNNVRGSRSDAWTGRLGKSVQYHSQDAMSGSYQYGYTGPHRAKSESSFDGITRGDADNGFRVQASNLPGPSPLVGGQEAAGLALEAKNPRLPEFQRKTLDWQGAEAPQLEQPQHRDHQRHYQHPSEVRQSSGPDLSSGTKTAKSHQLGDEEPRGIPVIRSGAAFVLQSPASGAILLPGYEAHQHHNYVLPSVFAAMPLSLLHTSTSHTQDSLGQYQYSYTGDTSAKTETRSLDGTTRGAYSYIDANGLLQQVHYIADRDGFRVLATNLPEA